MSYVSIFVSLIVIVLFLRKKRKGFLLLLSGASLIVPGVDLNLPVNFTAFTLLFYIIILLSYLFMQGNIRFIEGYSLIFVLFCLFATFSISYTEDIGFGIRALLKYIFPFLVFLFVLNLRPVDNVKLSSVINTATIFIVIGTFASGGIIIFLCGDHKFVPFYPERAYFAMDSVQIAIVLLCLISETRMTRKKQLIYACIIAWLIFNIVIGAYRMSLGAFAIVSTLLFFMFSKRITFYHLIYLFIVMGGYLGMSIFLSSMENVTNKMAYDNTSLYEMASTGDFSKLNDSGRSLIWETFTPRIENKPWFGYGCGSTQCYLYQHGEREIGHGAKVPHCEYIRLLHDFGYIGCGLFLLSWIIMLIDSFVIIKKSYNARRILAIIVFLLTVEFFIFMTTDNPLDYSMILSFQFIMYGLLKNPYYSEYLQNNSFENC